MAIAGGATTAYQCSVQNGNLVTSKTTSLMNLCVEPKDAVELLKLGKTVIVAGGDMTNVREMLRNGEKPNNAG